MIGSHKNLPLTVQSWPRAIAHIDGDAFFASVEQALNPALKGKAIVTGAERGIVTAASYEAKAFGIQRGVPLSEVTRLCPECTIVSSDYENYGLFSKRMFAILKRFSPDVEEYSIDEGFVDLTGVRRMYHCDYEKIGRMMQEAIHNELGITVSVGISLTKSLAKLASKFKKPHGLTAIPGTDIHTLLGQTPLEQIWGFGRNTTALLTKHKLKTALDFARQPVYVAERLLGKVGEEIWHELNGHSVFKLTNTIKESYASISKTRTFNPPSSNPHYLFAQALQNLENACAKARRYKLAAYKMALFLKTQAFKSRGAEIKIASGSASTLDLSLPLKQLFREIYERNTLYRTTGVILSNLKAAASIQFDLFSNPDQQLEHEKISQFIDAINAKFGQQTLFMGNRLLLKKAPGVTIRRCHLKIPSWSL